MAGTQKDHAVTSKSNSVKPVSSYNDKKAQPIPGKVFDKIMADSKAKAKTEVEKRKAPKTNWITKL